MVDIGQVPRGYVMSTALLVQLLTSLLLTASTVGGVAAALPTCATFAAVDIDGHDILPRNPPKVSSAHDCCMKALSMSAATAFAFSLSDGTCYVKGAGAKPTGKNINRLSGIINSTCTCDGGAFPPPCWTSPPPCSIGPGPSPPPGPPGKRLILGQYRCLPEDASSSFPYCDGSKTIAKRVASIVTNLTASELIAIVLKQPIERLKIPSYNMWADESLHGVRIWPERCPFDDNCTTIFPTASTASRSFNRTLWREIGVAMGTEARTLWNLNIIQDLSLRGPQVNIQRDPRWGRNSNSPSEDPLLTGTYGSELVRGTQLREPGGSGVHLMNSQMKHWTGYTVEANRMGYNGNFSLHDLAETYMVPMQMMSRVNVSSAMCSYNAVNGTPMCANGWMSRDVLRKHWGWDGVIESDCGALSNIMKTHHYAHDEIHAAAASMNGTCDVECDSVYSGALQKAHDAGLVTRAQLADAATRILVHRFQLGLFDDPRGGAFWNAPFNLSSSVHSHAHKMLAREAAQQGIVLVQNPLNTIEKERESTGRRLLPLDATASSPSRKYALIGPLGNITDPFLGDYRPAACPGKAQKAPAGTACLPTLLELLTARVSSAPQDDASTPAVAFAAGCDVECAAVDVAATSAAMADADIIILAIGEKVTDNDSGDNTGGEGNDRKTIGLPGKQSELITLALATKKPIIALIFSGGSVSVDALKQNRTTRFEAAAPPIAVLYCGFGGESGQNAAIDVLFGDARGQPSGRLPWTVYAEAWGDATPMDAGPTAMSMQAGDGRSYKYLSPSTPPLWTFGSGLSYGELTLAPKTTSAVALSALPTQVCATLVNAVGSPASDVVVTVFARASRSDLVDPPRLLPRKQLVDWWRGAAVPGDGNAVSVCVDLIDAQLALFDDAGTKAVYAGTYVVDFFDGKNTASVAVTVRNARILDVLPPLSNPTPPCCDGADRSCC